jgi:regulatory protein
MPDRRPPPPLDAPALERLALRYVERYATTTGKLRDYLKRKVRERGWEGPPADPHALAARMAALGYVDDRGWAEARAAALARRGLGARRVRDALRQAKVGEEDAAALGDDIAAREREAALAFARRRRFGPWARERAERDAVQRQLAAMLRAGHAPALSRRILALAPGEEADLSDLD